MPLAIQFVPDNLTYRGEDGVSLSMAAALCNILIEQPCGSRATCGKCRVLIRQGAPLPTKAERRLLTLDELKQGWRLACQVALDQNAVVEVPLLTRMLRAKGFGDADLLAAGFTPTVIKSCIELGDAQDRLGRAALDAISTALHQDRNLEIALTQLKRLSAAIKEKQQRISVVIEDNEILSAEPGDTTEHCYGLAYDLGSTSVAGALIEFKTGRVLAEATELNPQVAYGADIISRIHFTQIHDDGIEPLQKALLTAVRRILEHLTDTTGVNPEHVYAAMLVGNPTMIHSALGVDVSSLGRAPYVGIWTQGLTIKAKELGLPICGSANIHLLPMIHSHVGSDTVAAILAAGIDASLKWKLLIDLGTNSEVVLGNKNRIVVTSAAAGPAFEGVTVSHGMRATAGAIEGVYIGREGRITIKTIGNEPPKGICGSGFIDAVAELLRTGLITPAGRLKSSEESHSYRFPQLWQRIVTHNRERAVVLADATESASGQTVLLTATDIRQLQLVKGSIRAGISILCEHCGVTVDDLDDVLIAGAFGNYIRKASAVAIGLVPDVNPEVVRFVGNAAGAGCRLALVDQRTRERANRIRERAEYIELAAHPNYQELFAQAMRFPEPEEST